MRRTGVKMEAGARMVEEMEVVEVREEDSEAGEAGGDPEAEG